MIANEKIGQTPAEFDNLIDNTFKVVCGMNFRKGNQFIFATSDPTKLQSIRGRLFMVYSCGIPCYKIIPIKNSFRAENDNFSGYKRLIENIINNLLIIHS